MTDASAIRPYLIFASTSVPLRAMRRISRIIEAAIPFRSSPPLLSSRAKSRDLWSYRTRYSFAILPPIFVGRLCQTPTVTTRRFTETPYNSFLRDLATPTQYLRLCAGCFRFLDVTGAIVKQRKTCPADLIVGPELHRFSTSLDRFGKTP